MGFAETFGPPLIGSTLNFVLLGALLMQVYSYGKYWNVEGRPIRALVIFMVALAVADSANAFAILWTYLIVQNSNDDIRQRSGINQTLILQSVLYAIQTCTVQAFFIYRIYFYSAATSTSRKRYFLLLPILFWVATLGAMVYATYCLTTEKVLISTGVESIEIRSPPRYYILPAFVLTLVLDSILTFGLVKTFKRARNGFTSTDSRAEVLKRIALQTGSALCLSALLMIILYLLPYATFAYALAIPLPKLYDISLFSVLLARPLDEPSQATQRLMTELPSFNVTHASESQPLDRNTSTRSRSSSMSGSFRIVTSEMLRPLVDQVSITETTNQSTEEIGATRERYNGRRGSASLSIGSNSSARRSSILQEEILDEEATSNFTLPPAKAYRSASRRR